MQLLPSDEEIKEIEAQYGVSSYSVILPVLLVAGLIIVYVVFG